ncbi:MAG: zf-TFIIB domain-containing protein [Allosphingosinicella sp.]
MKHPYLCPVDQTPLVMSERQGIEIDYCPACRGVWLDRGELDKILERSALPAAATQPSHQPPPWPQPSGPHADFRGYGRPKRKKSFLEQLFD